ncbi:MAG: thioredoxin domain-containing protein, partial [Thermoanaerobaculia bacterium]
MKRRMHASALMASSLLVAGLSRAQARTEPARSVEQELQRYALAYLAFDPDSKISVEKAKETLPGFQGYKVVRSGRYEKLAVSRIVYVSLDRKWFFAGDSVVNPSPRPVTGAADLDWVEARYAKAFNRAIKASLTPERDAAGLKGVALQVDTGYMPVRMPGYVSPDGLAYFQGSLWDFTTDPRAERRRRIDLAANRSTGPAQAKVTLVEFADMECGYCRMRGLQLERLLEANAGAVAVRRHYKFFPLWMGHVWAMKAASAADCLFQHV